jgi:hypothetical protein
MSVNALQAVLDMAAQEANAPIPPSPAGVPRTTKPKASVLALTSDATEKPAKFFRPSRDNRKFVGGHFPPDVGKQLRMIAIEDDTTVQALLEEALNLLFVKKGRAKIEDITK